MLLLHDYVTNYGSEDPKRSKINDKNVNNSSEYFLIWPAWLIQNCFLRTDFFIIT